MILVNSGAFLSISSWFCEFTDLIFVMIPYISSTGYPPKRKGLWLCASSECVFCERVLVARKMGRAQKLKRGGGERREDYIEIYKLHIVG